eukprot:scaffold65496_cov63-Phaeocystis_antarctica.AAC.2
MPNCPYTLVWHLRFIEARHEARARGVNAPGAQRVSTHSIRLYYFTALPLLYRGPFTYYFTRHYICDMETTIMRSPSLFRTRSLRGGHLLRRGQEGLSQPDLKGALEAECAHLVTVAAGNLSRRGAQLLAAHRAIAVRVGDGHHFDRDRLRVFLAQPLAECIRELVDRHGAGLVGVAPA